MAHGFIEFHKPLGCPWDFPGKSTGVGCHCLLWYSWSLERGLGNALQERQEKKALTSRPIFPSGCEGKLGVALESLQGLRDLT